ncbi:sodium/glutamate symporter [Kiloniella majae]|uniref:sodium/glutamate symporter n=1 Tax=Kiloniella majae TaxID=1938558 RepID=UPI000A2775D4|nr:sodium/glutamate symporter [Kiloniella majae]
MKSNEYPIDTILIALLCAAVLILVGTLLRKAIPVLDRIHLPASVIGGVVGLIIGPQLLGAAILEGTHLEKQFTDIYAVGKLLPGYLIVVVFAALMMGSKIPTIGKIWSNSSPNLVTGYLITWGQYIVGIIVTILVLIPFFDANPLSSVLIAIGFQGGYGTAAGLGNTYDELGFDAGYDLALGMATAGKVSAILVGLILINFAVKKDQMQSPKEKKSEHLKEDISEKKAKTLFAKKRREEYLSADALLLHFSLLCIAIIIGWGLKEVLLIIESFFLTKGQDGMVQYIPLFPMALIGGICLQLFISKIGKEKLLNEHHLHSISHSFLDLLIVVAIATLSLKALQENWALLTILICTGIGWNLLVFFFIAPRLYKNAPWTRGLGDFAHSTGATTSGLLLMKVVDPNDKTGGRSSFSLKQPFYEPIVGGGFITAMALPLVHAAGLWVALAITTMLFLITVIIALKAVGVKKDNPLFDQK